MAWVMFRINAAFILSCGSSGVIGTGLFPDMFSGDV